MPSATMEIEDAEELRHVHTDPMEPCFLRSGRVHAMMISDTPWGYKVCEGQ